jgi:hypothetical protein
MATSQNAKLFAERAADEVCLLAWILDSADCKTGTESQPAPGSSETPPSIQDIESLKSLIILTTFLVECYGLVTATKIIMPAFGNWANILSHEDEIYRRCHVFSWSIIGHIVGFRKAAIESIRSRLDKWELPQVWSTTTKQSADAAEDTTNLLRFINGYNLDNSFSFSVGKWTVSNMTLLSNLAANRYKAAQHYALIEYLIEFGFPLRQPEILVHSMGLIANVEKDWHERGHTGGPEESKQPEDFESSLSPPQKPTAIGVREGELQDT